MNIRFKSCGDNYTDPIWSGSHNPVEAYLWKFSFKTAGWFWRSDGVIIDANVPIDSIISIIITSSMPIEDYFLSLNNLENLILILPCLRKKKFQFDYKYELNFRLVRAGKF